MAGIRQYRMSSERVYKLGSDLRKHLSPHFFVGGDVLWFKMVGALVICMLKKEC